MYPDLDIWMCGNVSCDNHPRSCGQPLIAFSSQRRQINDCLQPFTVSFTQKYTKEADNGEIESDGVGDVPTLPFVSVVWRHNETRGNFISVLELTAQYAHWPVHVILWLLLIIHTFIVFYVISNIFTSCVYFSHTDVFWSPFCHEKEKHNHVI